MNTQMSDTERLIKQLDDTAISLARQQWMESRDDESRRKWRKKLDDLLDSRLDLMKMRDLKKK